jgi:hypothetical protein
MAVCAYCKSTLVREGDSLRQIGHSAALFADHSPLALGARGQHHGRGFAILGRVQMAYRNVAGAPEGDGDEEGRWTEWHALFDDGESAWLSEDNGAYVLSTPWVPEQTDSKPLELRGLNAGDAVVVGGKAWTVGAIVLARVHAAEGELAFTPDFKNHFKLLELRNPRDEVLSVDTSEQPPRMFVGRPVALEALGLIGLKDVKQASQAQAKAAAIECPNCGASVAPTLADTKTISCDSCQSVIDISQGLGQDLKFYTQQNGLEPLIPLGKAGRLKVDGQVGDWQVVGYQERCEVPVDQSVDTEQTYWREYLLYNQQRGFAFLVDAEDGWSVVRPVTGVPGSKGGALSYRGLSFKQRFTYPAKTTHVLGEFYWRVRKDQRSLNADYIGVGSNSHMRLNREQSAQEVTWSLGQTLKDTEVIEAFGLQDLPADRFKRDVRVWSSLSTRSYNWGEVVVWSLLAVWIIYLLTQCSDPCTGVEENYGSNSYEYQQCRAQNRSGSGGGHGGSYGGYNSGGFHK